jgi:hypothetical protein
VRFRRNFVRFKRCKSSLCNAWLLYEKAIATIKRQGETTLNSAVKGKHKPLPVALIVLCPLVEVRC